ncbi:MAG: YicC family protein, partial [Bacteroidia bacterium]
LQTVLNFPEVITYTEEEVGENDWDLLHQTFLKALANFNQFREDEGSVLRKDLELRIQNILDFFAEIDKLAPLRVPQVKARLSQFLEEAVGKINIDQNRLEQELIYYIDKLDITEEKTRLKSHCDYFMETLKSKDANGKKLGFISQEIGREINTMGAKANDAQIQQLVVGMKEELEKIKEQLLNVL